MNIGASVIFGGISGSAVTDAATIGLLLNLELTPIGMLGLVALGLVLVGTVVGPGIQLILIVPMLVLTLVATGLDTLQVGVVRVLVSAIGLITPPVGILLYLTAAQA